MNTPPDAPDELDWLEAELADTLDEDYELELSEPALSLETGGALEHRRRQRKEARSPELH